MIKKEIEVVNAFENNLKNISLKIPRNKLVVVTGVSGSGKSSLVFDTIFAEGQRRYIETFSSYARQFMGDMKRPNVEKIEGLSPVVSIEQKTVNSTPRSTVGTITEIYDLLRLLYSKIGKAFSYETEKPMIKYSENELNNLLLSKYNKEKITIVSPLIKSRKGSHKALLEKYKNKGYIKIRIDGKITELSEYINLDKNKIHNIELIIDEIVVEEKQIVRLKRSVSHALKIGNKNIIIIHNNKDNYYSLDYICPDTGISYPKPIPNSFSFNSKFGWCNNCKGIGYKAELDSNILFSSNKETLSNSKQSIIKYLMSVNYIRNNIELIGVKYGFDFNTPFSKLSENSINALLNGEYSRFKAKLNNAKISRIYDIYFEGLNNMFISSENTRLKNKFSKAISSIIKKNVCRTCEGKRLKKTSNYFIINNKSISQVTNISIEKFYSWLLELEKKLTTKEKLISEEIIKEITKKTKVIIDIGLYYLNLGRESGTLSGGEAQRLRLSTQLGSKLVNVLYILDEPSIGLHQRDNNNLIKVLKELVQLNNSVIVVEHDQEMMESADYIIDIGPNAGIKGGEICAIGNLEKVLSSKNAYSETKDYLSGKTKIDIPKKRRKGNGKNIKLYGAEGNNLKKIDINFPLGKLICITGISGSGKSTLINKTLYPILHQHVYNFKTYPLKYNKCKGLENIDKVIEIDQSPIGKTPRSNPGTYIGILSDIRILLAQTPESKMRGYKLGRFSFNVKGGRCEECKGGGKKNIEMGFLPDVSVECDSCRGKRFNKETLQITYRGKNINDILNMNFNQALEFFDNLPRIKNKINTIVNVGLGYLKIGQSSTTLSGGEAQRVKLASELIKKSTGKTFYILDEPTTGLHFKDIDVLMKVINKLVDKGNTVLIIEHNLDVVKLSDHIIELGPEAGEKGGDVVFEGTPEQMVKKQIGITSKFLKNHI